MAPTNSQGCGAVLQATLSRAFRARKRIVNYWLMLNLNEETRYRGGEPDPPSGQARGHASPGPRSIENRLKIQNSSADTPIRPLPFPQYVVMHRLWKRKSGRA
jgi:hypothetical protein